MYASVLSKLELDLMATDPLNDFATLDWWKFSCIMYLSHSPLEAKDFQFKAQDEFSADRQASSFPFIATSYSRCRLWIGLHFMDFIQTVWNNFLQMNPGCSELVVGLKKNIMHFSISTCDTDAANTNVITTALNLDKIRQFGFSLDTQTRSIAKALILSFFSTNGVDNEWISFH